MSEPAEDIVQVIHERGAAYRARANVMGVDGRDCGGDGVRPAHWMAVFTLTHYLLTQAPQPA